MEYYSIGYITNPTLPDVTQDDVLKLTHINLAFGLVKDGLLDTHQLTNIGCIEQFRRWNPAIRIMLSVGGWGAGGLSTKAWPHAGRAPRAPPPGPGPPGGVRRGPLCPGGHHPGGEPGPGPGVHSGPTALQPT